MIAKLLKGNSDTDPDFLLLKLDSHSFEYLSLGHPIRVAFWLDNKVGEPWYKRKSMVVMIGKELNLDEYEENYKDESFKSGLVEKTYLKFSIQQIKKKLITMAKEELAVLGVGLALPSPQGDQQLIGDTKEIDSHPLKKEDIKFGDEAETVEIKTIEKEDKKFLRTDEVAEELGLSVVTVTHYVRMGKLKAELEGGKSVGNWFNKNYVKEIKKCPPPWLEKVQIKSVKRRDYKGSQREKAEGRQRVMRRIKKDIIKKTIPSGPSRTYETCRRGSGKMTIKWKKKKYHPRHPKS